MRTRVCCLSCDCVSARLFACGSALRIVECVCVCVRVVCVCARLCVRAYVCGKIRNRMDIDSYLDQ